MTRPTDASPSLPTTTLAELAQSVGGQVVGDNALEISDAGPLDDATPGMIVLVDHADRLQRAVESSASAVMAPVGIDAGNKPAILVDDVHAAFREIVARFHPAYCDLQTGVSPAANVDPSATIADTATIHPGATIGPNAVVGANTTVHSGAVVSANCAVGKETTLFANVVLYPGVTVGDRCLLHGGAVIGAYGFGYSQVEGRHVLTAQLGAVKIGDEVEIGAATCIDRGVYGPTRIGDGTKIDNLVQIGHNVQIGRHNLICSQVGIAGSTRTGDYVVMAGQTGVRDHVFIGDGAQLGAKCGVSNDVPAGTNMLGIPAVPERTQKLRFAAIAKLPEMRKEMKALRKQVAELQAMLPPESDSTTNDAVDRAA